MKQILFIPVCLFLTSFLFAQEMHVKQFNFISFRQDKKQVTDILEKRSSSRAKQHPEYGMLPYNAPCSECVEMIDERTVDTRKFIDPDDGKTVYLDKSYFPFHYKKSENDIWRTIDTRLKPDAVNPGLYIAPNQPAPTQCDLNTKTTTISNGYMSFEFNKNLSLYFFDEGSAYTATEKGNYSDYTIGEEGLQVKNMWSGIDMQQVFRTGEIETRYVITAPLALPIDKGWMVIEDHFTLPEGFTFQEKEGGERLQDGSFKGDYVVKNEKGQTMITYEKPVYFDAMAFGMHGNYKLVKNGNDYTLQMFVPVSWLSKKENLYPLYIDPTVTVGDVKEGDFRSTGSPSANFAYTTLALGSCDYNLSMSGVPLQLQFTDVYINMEYQLTYDNTCAFNTIAPYCTVSQVYMQVVCDLCNTTTGKLSCNPANPPYTGTCTTDPDLVPGAQALHYTAASFLPCYQPSCSTVDIPFTLKDQDSICGGVCEYLCARGNKLEVTIQACTVNGYIVQDKDSVCPGEPVTFTANPSCGVPPYHYIWVNGNQQDSIYGSNTYTISPQQSINGIFCYIFDTCNTFNVSNPNNFSVSNELNVKVLIPYAKAGPDINLCKGGMATLGGNPTTDNSSMIVWSGSDSTVQSWLSDTAAMNPQINVPDGIVDTFFYVVKVTNYAQCQSTDTVYIFSKDTLPAPAISVSGDTLISSVANSNQWYLNDTLIVGATARRYVTSLPGSYSVRTLDSTGCTSAASVPVTFTGISDLTKNALVTIYPNPASTELIISTSNFQPQWITLYDLNGKKIVEQKFPRELNISTLAAGVYFIEIKGAGVSVKKKFVKVSD